MTVLLAFDLHAPFLLKTNEIKKAIEKRFSLLPWHFYCNLHLTPGQNNVLIYIARARKYFF